MVISDGTFAIALRIFLAGVRQPVRIDYYSDSAFPTAQAITLLLTTDRLLDLVPALRILESDHMFIYACHLVIQVDMAKHIMLVKLMAARKP